MYSQCWPQIYDSTASASSAFPTDIKNLNLLRVQLLLSKKEPPTEDQVCKHMSLFYAQLHFTSRLQQINL